MVCVGPGDLGEDCCGRPAARGALCWGHLKQRERGQQLCPLKRSVSPFERVIVSGSAFLEAESDEEYRLRLADFRRAAEGWMRSEGWVPPPADTAAADGSSPQLLEVVA